MIEDTEGQVAAKIHQARMRSAIVPNLVVPIVIKQKHPGFDKLVAAHYVGGVCRAIIWMSTN